MSNFFLTRGIFKNEIKSKKSITIQFTDNFYHFPFLFSDEYTDLWRLFCRPLLLQFYSTQKFNFGDSYRRPFLASLSDANGLATLAVVRYTFTFFTALAVRFEGRLSCGNVGRLTLYMFTAYNNDDS